MKTIKILTMVVFAMLLSGGSVFAQQNNVYQKTSDEYKEESLFEKLGVIGNEVKSLHVLEWFFVNKKRVYRNQEDWDTIIKYYAYNEFEIKVHQYMAGAKIQKHLMEQRELTERVKSKIRTSIISDEGWDYGEIPKGQGRACFDAAAQKMKVETGFDNFYEYYKENRTLLEMLKELF